MIMRIGALLLTSVVVGACAAAYTVPRAAQPIPNPPEKVYHPPKPQQNLGGKIDPEVNSRLDSVEWNLRYLQGLLEQEPGKAKSAEQ